MEIIFITALVLLLVVLGSLVWRIARDAPDRAELARLQTRDQDYQEQVRLREEQWARMRALEKENTQLSAALDYERRNAAEKIKLLEDTEARLQTRFENIARKIVNEQGQTLSEQHRERLTGLLQPLREQLSDFRRRVDEVHQQGTVQSTELLKEVRQLQELSGKVSEDANLLAQAIKGEAKTQGDWGEVIVERIFEASGLTCGREYHRQETGRDEGGRLLRPDFIVRLPDQKAVIVDAKVSLTAYERHCSAGDDEAVRQSALAEHVRSVRRHVESLCGKNYTGMLGNQTLDFVIMCIPIESAYQAAMQADHDLLYDLARSHVVITGPSTLMITLKLIAQIWRRDNENRNAERIADRAGKLYDQVCRVAESMLDVRRKLEGTRDAFDLVLKRLSQGQGNLVKRVEDIRKLGAKVNKTLPAELREQGEED